MNFKVQTDDLLKALSAVSGVITSSPTLPILECFLFEIDRNKLQITASDVQTLMHTTVEIESESTGKIAVPSSMILDIFKNLPSQEVSVTINPENYNLGIEYFGGECNMAGYNGLEYPKHTTVDDAHVIEIKSELLLKAINKTLFATSSDDLQQALTGVYCSFDSDGLAFAATDKHKMSTYTRKDAPQAESGSFIFPKKPLTIIKALLKDSEDVLMTSNESNVSISFGKVVIVCRLIDAKYPNYRAVIPKDNNSRLTVNRLAFLSALKRVQIFSDKTTSLVRLKVAGQELSLKSEDIDYSTGGVERLTCSYDGADIEIGFNSKFLSEMISNIDSNEININLSGPLKGGLISPSDGIAEGEEVLMLAMPMRLGSNN